MNKKIKKFISKGLIASILFANISTNSLAGILSDDTRYETFDGININIDNILEENEVDVEVEGNTLVNILNYKSSNDFAALDGVVDESGYIEITADGGFKDFYVKKENINVKPSTQYTYFLEIVENTLIRHDGTNVNCVRMGGTHETNNPSYWKDSVWIEGGITGKYKFTLTTKDSFDDVITGDRGCVNWTTSGKIKLRYMIIEGNHLDKDINYFKGMKSSFENNLITQDMIENSQEKAENLGKYKVELKTTSKNKLLDTDSTSYNTFYLNSPLLKEDTIEKINGQVYHIKRNRKITLNGDENWTIYSSGTKENFITFRFYNDDMKFRPQITNDYFKVYEHKEWPSVLGYEKCILGGNTGDFGAIYISIPRNELATEDVDGFRTWIKSNPVNIVYELVEPVYEPVKTNLLLPLYTDRVYISTNSIIPANLKMTVDRAANRAKEYFEIAKLNPTVENLSIARMWINLMKESTLKDQFQEEINNIIQINGLEIERKKASANLDLYIKTKNTLSLSLDTNSVTFDNYSGVEDVELLNAVNLTINSSLPYSLNAYMEEGFYNSDKTNSLEVNSLNIRENTDTTYKQFTNIKEKVVLKDNCEEGNEKYHTIDLKLNGNNAHKTDVYKTVIKFEVEQK